MGWRFSERNIVILLLTSRFLKELNDIAALKNTSIKNITANISEYILDPKHQDFVIGAYYMSEALGLFYDYIHDFYSPILETEWSQRQNIILVTMIILTIFIIIIALLVTRYMKIYYKYLALSLSVMPIEKITEEEATAQIIGRFIRK